MTTMSDPDIVRTTGGVLKTPAGDLPVVAHLTYLTSDPVAVSMTLVAELEMCDGRMLVDQQTWVFGRNLIDQAACTMLPTGDGDVTVEYLPVPDLFQLTLTDVYGKKHALYLEAEPVIEFMAASFALVPADGEVVDVDGAIERLLAESEDQR